LPHIVPQRVFSGKYGRGGGGGGEKFNQ